MDLTKVEYLVRATISIARLRHLRLKVVIILMLVQFWQRILLGMLMFLLRIDVVLGRGYDAIQSSEYITHIFLIAFLLVTQVLQQ